MVFRSLFKVEGGGVQLGVHRLVQGGVQGRTEALPPGPAGRQPGLSDCLCPSSDLCSVSYLLCESGQTT